VCCMRSRTKEVKSLAPWNSRLLNIQSFQIRWKLAKKLATLLYPAQDSGALQKSRKTVFNWQKFVPIAPSRGCQTQDRFLADLSSWIGEKARILDRTTFLQGWYSERLIAFFLCQWTASDMIPSTYFVLVIQSFNFHWWYLPSFS
jgi:hypothetical protein